jgi:hypothetical protein
MRRGTAPTIALCVLAFAAACGGDPEPDPNCGIAAADLMDQIAAGPRPTQPQRQIDFQGQITPVRGATYPYPEGGGGTGTAIAMEFTVPGVADPVTGVWAQTSGTGIFTSDAQSQTFTAWPNELSNGTVILPNPSPEGTAAKECLDSQG